VWSDLFGIRDESLQLLLQRLLSLLADLHRRLFTLKDNVLVGYCYLLVFVVDATKLLELPISLGLHDLGQGLAVNDGHVTADEAATRSVC